MKITSLIRKQYGAIVVATLAAGLLQPLTASADTIVTEWDDVLLQAIRDTHPGPTVVARALAVVHTAMFDSWAAYDSKAIGTRMGRVLSQPRKDHTDANKHKAISYAAYTALVDLFPTEKAKFDSKMAALNYPVDVTYRITDKPAVVGRIAAQAVVEYRHRDGSNQLGNLTPGGEPYSDYTGYAPANTVENFSAPNRWQPLDVPGHLGCHGTTSVQIFCTPQWSRVTPFAMRSGDQFRPMNGPATINQEKYREQARDIVQITASLDDTKKVIAEYWADGPRSELPPGHWALFAKYVSIRDRHTIDQDVKMYFALTNALLDASIAAWDAKRYYDSERPISAIRHLFKDELLPYVDGATIVGKDWKPYQPRLVVTPPFAEFTSGHSAFSRAAAEVLKRFTGSDRFGKSETVAAGSSRVQPGVVPNQPVVLTWPTFTAAADEAGISRRYGGIHFEQGDIVGREIGAKVGDLVWEKAQYHFGEN